MGDFEDGLAIGIVCTVIVMVFGVVLPIGIAGIDNIDIDDTLGPYMCDEHGLDFINAEVTWRGDGTIKDLQIICKDRVNATSVDDGYLIKV